MAWSDEFAFRDCGWCGVRDVAMAVQIHFDARRASGQVRSWAVLTCPRCGGAVTIEYDRQSALQEVVRVNPEKPNLVSVRHLPPDVHEYLTGAIVVLDAGVPDAAAVQLRRALEAATKHHGVQEKTLVGAIQRLIERNLVTAQFGHVLHHVRKVGNQGAHATDERVSQEEIERALRFTVAVLRNLFEIPAELAALAASTDGSEGQSQKGGCAAQA